MGDERWVGFDVAALDARIGLNGVNLPPGDLEACSHHGAEGGGTPPPATRRATPMSIVHPDQAVELAPACIGLARWTRICAALTLFCPPPTAPATTRTWCAASRAWR